MCISSTSIRGRIGEIECIKQLLRTALRYEKQYEIIPSFPAIEGAPYDVGFSVRKKDGSWSAEYRIQAKSTYKTSEGELSFGTSRKNGKRYSENEIDFFFLYYCDIETGEEWRGLALPSECPTKTNIAYNSFLSKARRQVDDFDFDCRFNELIETRTIKPINMGQEDVEYPDVLEEPEEPNELAALDLTDDNVFSSLLSQYDYKLDDIAHALKMDKKVFMQYHAAYVNRIPSYNAVP